MFTFMVFFANTHHLFDISEMQPPIKAVLQENLVNSLVITIFQCVFQKNIIIKAEAACNSF